MYYQSKPKLVKAAQVALGLNLKELFPLQYQQGDVFRREDGSVSTKTNHGWSIAVPGDWIILTEAGEVYPCSHVEFVRIYTPVVPVSPLVLMEQQANDLHQQLQAMRLTFGTPAFEGLAEAEKQAQYTQASFMTNLVAVLRQRIERAKAGRTQAT
jgi:hypothetical protein